MQMLGEQNAVKKINRFIKKLQMLRHSKKESISAKPRSERIQLIRSLQSLQSMLPKLSTQERFVSASSFIHTSINGNRILLHKAVLISKTPIHRQVPHSKYSTMKMDQIIKQLVHLKNNLDHYSVMMDHSQKASIMRIINSYTRKPSFKKMNAINYKLNKTPLKKIERTEIKNNTSQSKSAHISNMNKGTSQNKQIHTEAKKPVQKEMGKKIINDRKRSKPIRNVPKKMNEQENYHPYAEQDLDIYMDSLLEERIDQNLDLEDIDSTDTL